MHEWLKKESWIKKHVPTSLKIHYSQQQTNHLNIKSIAGSDFWYTYGYYRGGGVVVRAYVYQAKGSEWEAS